jgi:hypothetical protein
VNEDDDCIGLGSGESSGSSSLPTTWWEVWEQFSHACSGVCSLKIE